MVFQACVGLLFLLTISVLDHVAKFNETLVNVGCCKNLSVQLMNIIDLEQTIKKEKHTANFERVNTSLSVGVSKLGW